MLNLTYNLKYYLRCRHCRKSVSFFENMTSFYNFSWSAALSKRCLLQCRTFNTCFDLLLAYSQIKYFTQSLIDLASDSKNNISDEEETVESEECKNDIDQALPDDRDDAT